MIKLYKLSEIIGIIGGGTPKTTVQEYWNGNIPWLSVKDFNGDKKKVYQTEKHITLKGLKESSTKLLQKGDIIISARGTVGEVAILGNEMAFNQSCYGIRAKEGLAINDYIYYYLRNSIQKIKNNTHGSVFDTITRDTFDVLEISLPPLAEQKRIAEILSSLDDKIELNERMNKNLEEQAQALFKHWFVDFEFPDDEGKPYKSNGGDLVESELGLIPRGWRVGTLEDICLIKNGFAFKSEEYRENGRKVVRTKNFNNGYVEDNDNVYISVESEEKYSQYLLMKKDFLLVMVGASIGNFVVVTEDVLPALQNQNMWNFRSKNISQEFLNYALLDVVKSNIGQASGSAREFFQKRTFYKIKILIPHNSAVEKFSKIINDNYSIITNIRRETQNLKKLRDTLLPRLMSGEV